MLTSTIPAAILTMAAITGQPRGEVIDFSATWCGPCQRMAPIVAKLERAGYPIRSVDVDSNRALAEKYAISSIPAFVLVVDGKEVTRVVGAVPEQQLVGMLSQIPTDPPVMAASKDTRQRSRGTEPPRPQPTASREAQPAPRTPSRDFTQPVAVATDETPQGRSPSTAGSGTKNPSPGLIGKLFGRGKQQPAPQTPDVVRANIESKAAESANVLPVRNPVEASVRLHVTINGQTRKGSGTAVDSRAGQTIIATCAHLFDGWNDRSKIEVDLFLGGEIQRFVGRMIHYDMAADVGLVGIPTDHLVPTAEVGPTASRPQVQDAVVSIGCSGGQAPSQKQIQVTALNYYEGPDNIECTGVPVQGRSGGGLFNRQGQLVGVCIAADAERQRGAYAGLLAIHGLLAATGLSDLYQAEPATTAPAASGASLASDGTVPVTLAGTIPEPAAQQRPANAALTSASGPEASTAPAGDVVGDMEVICIIRSRQQPNAPSRVVIIDRPSAKFVSYLDGEVAARETPVRANRTPSLPTTQPADPPRTATAPHTPTSPRTPASSSAPFPASARAPAASSRFSIPSRQDASSAAAPPVQHSRSASLQPTALAQPFRPQQYVRSPHTRPNR